MSAFMPVLSLFTKNARVKGLLNLPDAQWFVIRAKINMALLAGNVADLHPILETVKYWLNDLTGKIDKSWVKRWEGKMADSITDTKKDAYQWLKGPNQEWKTIWSGSVLIIRSKLSIN